MQEEHIVGTTSLLGANPLGDKRDNTDTDRNFWVHQLCFGELTWNFFSISKTMTTKP